MIGRYKLPFTYEERKEIEILIKKGFSGCEISRKINRSKNGVITEIRRGGGREYLAKTAQKIVDDNKMAKYTKLSERNRGNKVTFKIKKRIENLEMQLEILHDVVKELVSR